MSKKRSTSKVTGNIPKNTIKIVDLFAGIGGFHYGINKAARARGMNVLPLLVSEIDESCRDVYEKNFRCKVEGDIKKINFKSYRRKHKITVEADILTAGFPCQPFSNSGRKRGLSDPRGKFLGKIVECIHVFKPKSFILENVPGMRTSGGKLKGSTLAFAQPQKIGHAMHTLEKKLSIELGKEYEIIWLELDSSKFGSAQVRKRVYIIGVKKRILKKQKTNIKELATRLSETDNRRKLFIDIADKIKPYNDSLNFSENQKANLMRNLKLRKQPSFMNGMRRVGKAYHCPGGNVGQGYHAYGKVPTLTKVWARFLPIYFPHPSEIRQKPRHDDRELRIGKGYGTGNFRRASVNEVMRLQGFMISDFKPHKVDRVAYEQAGNAVNALVVKAISDNLVGIIFSN